MSGSSPGDPFDETGESADQRRDRRGEQRTDERRASGGSRTNSDRVTIEDDGILRWFWKSNDGNVVFVRDILSSVAIVAVIGLILFAVSGVWPPLVAVESGSMEPNMERGDLIFVVDEGRYVGDGPVDGTGVVTRENAQESGHEKFNGPGDVIVFKPNGNEYETPVIHRAHFWVEEGENWVDTKADEDIVGDTTCEDVRTCPANHDGFITKGDANNGYDQLHDGATTGVVKPEWITGKAMFRIPWLGHIRLAFDSIFGTLIMPSPVSGGAPAATTGPGPAIAQVGLVAATGLGATGAAAAGAVGRYRNRR